MATITRTNLFQALEDASDEFVSKEARHRLCAWAYDAKSFTVGDWDDCPLDQVGLVKRFEGRARYSADENSRFANEASELDAQILKHVRCDVRGQLSGGLKVYITN